MNQTHGRRQCHLLNKDLTQTFTIQNNPCTDGVFQPVDKFWWDEKTQTCSADGLIANTSGSTLLPQTGVIVDFTIPQVSVASVVCPQTSNS